MAGKWAGLSSFDAQTFRVNFEKPGKRQAGGGQEASGVINIYRELLHAKKEFLKCLFRMGIGCLSFLK